MPAQVKIFQFRVDEHELSDLDQYFEFSVTEDLGMRLGVAT
jgi:hypothetical protein